MAHLIRALLVAGSLLGLALPAHAEVVTAIVYVVGTLAGVSATVLAVATMVVSMASAAYQSHQAKKKARAAAMRQIAQDLANMQDRTVTVLQSDTPHRTIYGAPGPIAGAIVAMFSSGQGAQWTHLVILWAPHPCEGIDEIYIDADPVQADADGWATNQALWVKSVPGDPDEGAAVHVSHHLGWGNTDVADAYLMEKCPGMWTADHKFSGYTYSVVSVNKVFERFRGGLSFKVLARPRGKRVLDVRSGQVVYSRNPALCLADFLVSEQGYQAEWDQIDLDDLVAAANACDDIIYGPEALTDLDNYGGSQARYTVDGMFSADQERDNTRQQLEEAMAGRCLESAGVWRILAGAWSTPVMHLTDADLLKPTSVEQTANPSTARYNSAKGSYVRATGNGASEEFSPYVNATFLDLDGVPRNKDLALPWTGAHMRAHQLGRVAVERSRGGFTVRVHPKMHAWSLQPGDRVQLTDSYLGVVAKNFIVTDWVYSRTAPLSLLLEEDEPEYYDAADEVRADASPNTNLANPFAQPNAPQGLKVSSGLDAAALQGATLVVRAHVRWNRAVDARVLFGGLVRLQWRVEVPAGQDENPWQAMELPGESVETYLLGLDVDAPYMVRVQFVTSLARSAWAYFGHTVEGNTENPADVSGLELWIANDGIRARWAAPTGVDLIEWDATQVRRGATWLAAAADVRFDGRTTTAPLGWFPAGTQVVWAAHHAVTGRWSTPISAAIVISAPAQPVVSFGLSMQFVQLKWADCRTSQPIAYYLVRRGQAWATAQALGQATATTFNLQAAQLGADRYWVAAVDLGGNVGLPASVDVTVDQIIEGALDALDKQLGDAFQLLQSGLDTTNTNWAAAVAAEAQNRAQAIIAAAQQSAADLAAEAQQRATAITQAVATEAQSRAQALLAEAQARAAAISDAATSEAQARTAGLAQEAQNRTAALATEVLNRNAAIQQSATALQASIDTLHAQLGDIIGAADYDAAKAYGVGELVKAGGKLYRSIAATVGNAPPNAGYWQLVGNYDSIGEAVAGLAAQSEEQLARIQTVEGGLAVQASSMQNVQGRLQSVETQTTANAGAIGGLQSLTTDINGRVSAQAQDVLSLQALTRTDLGSLVRDGRFERLGTWYAINRTAASAAGVPSGAPSAFVGFQTGRDGAEMGQEWRVRKGDLYWLTCEAASSVATLRFTLGVHFWSDVTNQHTWIGAGATDNTGGLWVQLRGEVAPPTWATHAATWTQIDGGGDLSGQGWYVTNIDARNIASQSVTKGAIQAQATANAATSARVDQQGSTLTSHTASLVDLGNRLTTAEGKVTAQSTAQAQLQSRVEQTEHSIQVMGEDAVALRATVAGKADTSALQSLSQLVHSQGEDLTAKTGQLTSLEAALATKAAASALDATNATVAQVQGALDATSARTSAVEARQARIRNYRVMAVGNLAQHPTLAAGLYDETGARFVDPGRSWNTFGLDGQGNVYGWTAWDVYAGAGDALANALTGNPYRLFTGFLTCDEPSSGMSAALRAQLIDYGATAAVIDTLPYRGAYILIGYRGAGEGGGIEVVSPYGGEARAWVSYDLQVINGWPVGLAGSPGSVKADAALATAQQSTLAKVNQQGADIALQAGQLVSLASRLGTAEQDNSAQSGLISGLRSDVTNINGTLTAHTQRLDQQQAAIGTKASSSALDATNATVSDVSGRLTSEAARTTALTARMDNLAVGGANLINGTRDFSGGIETNNYCPIDGEWNGLKVCRMDSNWSYRRFVMPWTPGETYTLSFWGRSNSGTDAGFYFDGGLGSWALTPDWRRYSKTLTAPADGRWNNVFARVESANASERGPWWLAGFKVERGVIATDWTPSAADVSAADAKLVAESAARADGDGALAQQLVGLQGQVAGKAESSALQSLTLTVQSHGTDLSTKTGQLVSLENRMQGAEGQLAGHTGAISLLESGVSSINGTLTAHTQRLDQQQASIAGKADATALQSMGQTVQQHGADLSTQSALIAGMRASLGGSTNLVRDAEFVYGTTYWQPRRADAVYDIWGPGTWVPPGCTALHFAGDFDWSFGDCEPVPVGTNQRFGAAVYVAQHRCNTATFELIFLDQAMGEIWKVNAGPATASGGNDLALWDRLRLITDVPAGARWAKIRPLARGQLGNNPHAWFCRPMLFTAAAGQTEPPPWSPSATGLDGAVKASADAISVLESRASSLDGAVSLHSGQLTSLGNRLDSAEGVNTAQAGLISGLRADVTNINGTLTSHTQRLDQQQAAIGTKAAASALDATNATVAQVQGALDATTSRTTNMEARLARVRNYRVMAVGAAAQHPLQAAGLYDETGARFVDPGRSWNTFGIDAQGNVYGWGPWDVFAGAGDTLANALSGNPYRLFTGFVTCDEPSTGMTAALRAQLIDYGATSASIDALPYRGAYILIGYKGAGEGGGIEVLSPYGGEARAWVSYDLQVVNGWPVGLAGSPGSVRADAALASAQQSTLAKVNQQGADIAAQAGQLVSFGTRLGTVEQDNGAQAGAIAGLQSSTTQLGGQIATVAQDLVSLQALARTDLGSLVRDGRFDRAGTWYGVGRVAANAAGVPAGAPSSFVGFQTNRDAYETGQEWQPHKGDVYWVTATVASSVATLAFSVGLHFWSTVTGQHHWHAADATPTNTGGAWKLLAGDVPTPEWATNAQVWMQINGGGDLSGQGWHVTNVDARNVTSQQATKVALQAQASANSATSARVDQQGTDLVAQAASTAQLKARADGVDAKTATIEQNLTVVASTAGTALSRYTFRMDTNGYVTGMLFDNNGSTGRVAWLTDVFTIGQPGYADKPVFTVGTVGGAGALGFRGNMYLDGSITVQALNADSLAARIAKLGYVEAAQINMTWGQYGGTGENWSYMRSYGKWIGDGQWGFIFGRRGSDGHVIAEINGPNMGLQMNGPAGWMRFFGPGFNLDTGGLTIDQIDVIKTLNVQGGAITVPFAAAGNGAAIVQLSIPAGQSWAVQADAQTMGGETASGNQHYVHVDLHRGEDNSLISSDGTNLRTYYVQFSEGEAGSEYKRLGEPGRFVRLMYLGPGIYNIWGTSLVGRVTLLVQVVKKP